MQAFMIAEPVQVFWTPYDPLDLASGSLDPLGSARGYLALADRLLPGFTTVTTVPRYVSMLCAALKSAQMEVPATAGVNGRRCDDGRAKGGHPPLGFVPSSFAQFAETGHRG